MPAILPDPDLFSLRLDAGCEAVRAGLEEGLAHRDLAAKVWRMMRDTRRPAGRPARFTRVEFDAAVEEVRGGRSVYAIQREKGLSGQTTARIRERVKELAAMQTTKG